MTKSKARVMDTQQPPCVGARTSGANLRPRRVGGLVALLPLLPFAATADPLLAPGAKAGIAEIEACASRHLPSDAGEIVFRVEAVDRVGERTRSRASVRWRKDDEALSQIVLRVSEPAKTAGTALLIVDRQSGEPEFHLRLPEIPKVRRVRSRRLQGPVLGTDFSFEDLNRLREPLDRTDLELIGTAEVEGRPAWLLETRPDPGTSDYARVLTWVEQIDCLPVRIELFDAADRLRKRLRAPLDEIRKVGGSRLPHVFVMEDLRRETHTVVHIERVEARDDWPAAQFTRHALQEIPSLPGAP